MNTLQTENVYAVCQAFGRMPELGGAKSLGELKAKEPTE